MMNTQDNLKMNCISLIQTNESSNVNNVYRYSDDSLMQKDANSFKRKCELIENESNPQAGKLINTKPQKKEYIKKDTQSKKKQNSMEIGLQKRRSYDLLLTKEKDNSSRINSHDPKQDPRGPYQVQKNVKLLLQTWGNVVSVAPDFFLSQLLESRGYDNVYINSLDQRNIRSPTVHQLESYDNELVWAIRNSDLPQLKVLWESGRNMSACNKFSESVIHMACRRADLDVVEFILTHGGNIGIIDDYGRTPLHDACWRIEPRFDIVTMILDINIDLVRFADKRGSIPLHYVRPEHWMQWCAYFYHQREKYWPKIESTDLTNQNKSSSDTNSETFITDTSNNSTSSSTTSSYEPEPSFSISNNHEERGRTKKVMKKDDNA